jgi:hypothetical protein
MSFAVRSAGRRENDRLLEKIPATKVGFAGEKETLVANPNKQHQHMIKMTCNLRMIDSITGKQALLGFFRQNKTGGASRLLWHGPATNVLANACTLG